jgi:uncharacterized protein (TIGR01777 family)
MHILLTGASGLIGSALAPFLAIGGHEVTKLSRAASPANGANAWWNPATSQINLGGVGDLEAVIHLAGEPLGGRWSPSKKQRIRDSRVNGTRSLSEALIRIPRPPKVLVCASATGFYGSRGDELLDEQSASGSGFLAEVCRAWEAATAPAAEGGIRVVNLRIGVVLSSKGGALARMLPAFRLGLGGKLGKGAQYWSWIAMEDLLGAIHHGLLNQNLRGAVNAVSSQPVTNEEFTHTLGALLRRPTFCAVPVFALKLLFGELAEAALLASARVRPARLEQTGFSFRFPRLGEALRHSLEHCQ